MLALGVVLLVFLVALGSSRSLDHVSGPTDLTSARLVAGDLILLLVGLLLISAMLYVIWDWLQAPLAVRALDGVDLDFLVERVGQH